MTDKKRGIHELYRDDPADAEAVSHKLLVRAGFIRQLSSGIYSLLPLGFRVCHKITEIVRSEMRAIGVEVVVGEGQPGVEVLGMRGEMVEDLLLLARRGCGDRPGGRDLSRRRS